MKKILNLFKEMPSLMYSNPPKHKKIKKKFPIGRYNYVDFSKACKRSNHNNCYALKCKCFCHDLI